MPNELKYHKASHTVHTVHSSTYCTDPFYHKSRVVKETRGNCNALNIIGIYYFALYYYNTISIGFFFGCPICCKHGFYLKVVGYELQNMNHRCQQCCW